MSRDHIKLVALAVLLAVAAAASLKPVLVERARRQSSEEAVAVRNAAWDADHPPISLLPTPPERPEDFVAAVDCAPVGGRTVDKAQCAASLAVADRAREAAAVETEAQARAEWDRELAAFRAEQKARLAAGVRAAAAPNAAP